MADGAGHHLVCGSRPWNRATFEQLSVIEHGTWAFVSTPEELDTALASGPAPDWVFFLHWSWIVPSSVHGTYRCVVFHMTDLPYGRGGNPLQHLILAGANETVLSAIAMTDQLDAGPVYAKRPLSLEGTAEDIYRRTDAAAATVIAYLVANAPDPVPQQGEPVVFARRRPEQSEVPTDLADLDAWYDFVRMLDAVGYPHAFIDHGGYRISLRRASLGDGRMSVDATIEPAPAPPSAEEAP